MKTPKEQAIHQETTRKRSNHIEQEQSQETQQKQTTQTPNDQAIHQDTTRKPSKHIKQQ